MSTHSKPESSLNSVILTPQPKQSEHVMHDSNCKLVATEKKQDINNLKRESILKAKSSRPSSGRQISPDYEYQMGLRQPENESGCISQLFSNQPGKASTPALREMVHSASLLADVKASPLTSARNKVNYMIPNNSENTLKLKGVNQPFTRLFAKRPINEGKETSRSQIYEPSASISTGS